MDLGRRQVTEAFDADREGESYARTLMKFDNGQTAVLSALALDVKFIQMPLSILHQ